MTPANAAPSFVDHPIEEGAGDRVAIAGPDTRVTYQELRDLTDRTAGGLLRMGVERADRVALLLPDGPAFAAVFFAALKLGAVAVPLNTRLAGGDLRAILDDCRPRVLVTDPRLVAAAGSRDIAACADRVATCNELLATSPPPSSVRAEPVGADAMAFWLYTSGTTGTPKAAVHAHRTLLAWHGYGRGVLAAGSGDRVFATSKLFFAYALGNALLIPLAARASTYLCPDWPDAAAVAGAVRAYRPTLFFSVPTFYSRLLGAGLPSESFASVRVSVSAGERLPSELSHAWRARFGVEILDGIGATETVFMVLSNRPGESRAGLDGPARARRRGAHRGRGGAGRRGGARGCPVGQGAVGRGGILGAPRAVSADVRRASGSAPETCAYATPTATTTTAAARTTSSRSPASGCRRGASSRRCSSIPRWPTQEWRVPRTRPDWSSPSRSSCLARRGPVPRRSSRSSSACSSAGSRPTSGRATS